MTAPNKGYTRQVHTRTEPDGYEGLVLLAGDDHLSDTLNDLGHAAKDPMKAAAIRAIIKDNHAPLHSPIPTSGAAHPAVLPLAMAQDSEKAKVLPFTKPERVQAPGGEGPNLWALLCAPLTKIVSEANYEIWLSSVRFSGANETTLFLLVPNTHFQEYLGEHYTEVIQEVALEVHGRHYDIEWVIPAERPQEAPKKVDPPKPPSPSDNVKAPRDREEALGLESRKEGDPYLARLEQEWRKGFLPEPLEPCDVPQLEQQQALEDLAWALARDKAVEQIAYNSGQSLAYFASKNKRAEARWAAEDKLRQAKHAQERKALVARLLPALLTQPGNPHDQKQYHDREWREAAGDAAKRNPIGSASTSPFETSGGATRKDLKEALDAFPKPKKPKKPDSS